MSGSTPNIAPDSPNTGSVLPATGVLHVAVGVIADRDGRVLIAERPPGVHLEGCWEFPGGKVEPGETVADALKRELDEELGIEVRQASPLIKIRHNYPERSVLLDVWRVEAFAGQARGREGQGLRWVEKNELVQVRFPPANRPIAAAARLPCRYAVLDSESGDFEVLEALLSRLAQNGIRLIQLRAKGLREASRYRTFAECALEYCRARDIVLLLNADPHLAREIGADGVHLNAARLMALSARPLDTGRWVAASCHDWKELRRAERIQVDFAVLSPVCRTPTHPEVRPLGWAAFADLVDRVNIPVYALGGLTEADLPRARAHGAQGIAAVRGFL